MFTVQWRIHPDLQISGGGGDLPRIRHSTKCEGSVVDHVVLSLCICRSVDDHIRVLLQIKVAICLHQRSNNGMMNRVAARSRTNAVRMLVLIVLRYVFSLGPPVFLAMLRSFGVDLSNLSFDVLLLASWIAEFAAFTSSLGNPVIYEYYNGDFRKEEEQKRLILAH